MPSPSNIRGDLLAAAEECDRAATALALALRRRRDAIRAAVRARIIARPIAAKMDGRRAVDAGMAAADLAAFTSSERTSPRARRTFSEQASALVGASDGGEADGPIDRD